MTSRYVVIIFGTLTFLCGFAADVSDKNNCGYHCKSVEGVSKIYVINLDRCKDRLAKMTVSLGSYGIAFQRFKAINGFDLKVVDLWTGKQIDFKQIDPSKSSKYMVFSKDKTLDCPSFMVNTYVHSTSAGELGCSMSHICIWKDIVKNNYTSAIVFEDDVVFLSDFRKKLDLLISCIPEDADIVFLGVQIFDGRYTFIDPNRLIISIGESDSSGKFVKLNKMGTFCGTHAYYITAKGAKKMLELKSEYNAPIDRAMMYFYREFDDLDINIYVAKEKLSYVPTDVKSIIAEMGRG